MVDFNRNRDSGRREVSSRDEASTRRTTSRDDDRGSSRGGERGGRDSGGGRYSYQPRDRASVDKRASMGANDFDKIMKEHIKMWTPKAGNNRIRILPPTWAKPDHYGFDVFVHYGVGPDRQSYLDLAKMKDEPDPITEEMNALRRDGGATDEEIKQLESRRRVVVYIIDRDNEAEGAQAWAMSWTIDKDISILSVDKSTGAVLNIDDPEEGYDVEFRRDGEGIKTKYSGIAIARRASRLGKSAWLNFAIDNPIPDQLQYFTYDEIAKTFGGGGAHREAPRDQGRDDRGGSDRERDRGRDDDRSTGRDDPPARGRGRESRDEPTHSWEDIHSMTSDELDALVDSDDRLHGIDVNKAETDAELADWICEDLKIVKEVAREEPVARGRRSAEPPPDDAGDKLARMREERGRSRR